MNLVPLCSVLVDIPVDFCQQQQVSFNRPEATVYLQVSTQYAKCSSSPIFMTHVHMNQWLNDAA